MCARVWENNDLTLCFQNCVLHPVLLGLLVCLVIYRCAGLARKPRTSQTGFVSRLELSVALILAVIKVSLLVVDSLDPGHSTTTCREVADIVSAVTWVLAVMLIRTESGVGKLASRLERIWWILAFALAVVQMRTNINILRHGSFPNGHSCTSSACQATVYVRLASMPLYFLLAIFALFQPDSEPQSEKPSIVSPHDSRTRLLDATATPVVYGVSSDVDLPPARMDYGSIFERLTFWWMNPLLQMGSRIPLDYPTLPSLPPPDTSSASMSELAKGWAIYGRDRAPEHASFFRALHHAFGFYFWVTGSIKVINDVTIFLGPLLLHRIVSFLENGEGPEWHGYALAVAIFLSTEVQSLAMGQYFFRGFRQGLRVRAAICSMVFHKSLVLSYNARARFGVGRIVSLMQIDAQKLCDAVPYLHLTWSAPFQLAIAIWLLYGQVGVSAFAGLGVLVLLMPLNTFVARKQARYTRLTMEARDKRVKLVSEVMAGVRIVKMFGWEESYARKIGELREIELKQVRSNALYGAFSAFLWGSTPMLVSTSTFFTYVALGNTLTAARAFTALALFNVLRFPLNALPSAVTRWIDTAVSVRRLWEFLLAEEIRETVISQPNNTSTNEMASYVRVIGTDPPSSSPLSTTMALVIENASFSWPDPNQEGERITVLHDISLSFPQKSFTAIVGTVGSGKSSLLDAMLNEIQVDCGRVWINGSVAFCAQQAWIQNATVKENILFGKPFDQTRYNQIVHACALEADLTVLADGDQTEIGERGINLSGGQKQRIALARACYADCDVYLLDDVLSAVDVHVGQHIVKHCLTRLLKEKTVILATHQIQWLSLCDTVVVLKDERVSAVGSYAELVNKVDFGPLAEQMEVDHASPASKPERSDAPSVPPLTKSQGHGHGHGHGHIQKGEDKGKLIQTEEREKGMVAFRIWKVYAVALGVLFFVVIMTMYAVAQGLQVGSNVWLSVWSSDSKHRSGSYYLEIYCALSLSAASLVYFRSLLNAIATIKAARRIHTGVLWALLRSPCRFFDSTPLGRILNRVSQDQQTVDVTMRWTVQSLFNTFAMIIGAVLTLSFATPYVLAILLPVSLLYYRVQRLYRFSARELQRLDSISKSPIYTAFSEALQGASTIRAYRRADDFAIASHIRIDKNLTAALPAYAANRWLAVRLEFLGATIIGAAAMISILEKSSRGNAAGLAGLALTYALEITSILNWLIRVFTSAELQMVSVERLMQWEELPAEAPLESASSPPPPSWPSRGEVAFRGVSMRYREGLPLVLRQVSFVVQPGERVGVVGRTGSGKSSMLVALFRMVEIEQGGQILIDDIDTSQVGLHELRKRISIIPQDPTLFSGTLRHNLDPFNVYTEEDLWEVLERCSMGTAVRARQEGLDMLIEPGGENLSVGQRQLVCLGRALLRKSRVLVLDEATASIDGETDMLIQRTLRENVSNCTVITIAHRIHTVMGCDRIIVMDRGEVVESGPPQELIDRGGVFSEMARGSASAS